MLVSLFALSLAWSADQAKPGWVVRHAQGELTIASPTPEGLTLRLFRGVRPGEIQIRVSLGSVQNAWASDWAASNGGGPTEHIYAFWRSQRSCEPGRQFAGAEALYLVTATHWKAVLAENGLAGPRDTPEELDALFRIHANPPNPMAHLESLADGNLRVTVDADSDGSVEVRADSRFDLGPAVCPPDEGPSRPEARD
jgi:hypothetical protein